MSEQEQSTENQEKKSLWKRFRHSRICFFSVLLLLCLNQAVMLLIFSEEPPGGETLWCLLIPALLGGGMWLARRRGEDMLPPAAFLWALLGLSFFCNCIGNVFAFVDYHVLHIAICAGIASLTLFWVLFRGWAAIFWAPFFTFQVLQLFGFFQYGSTVNSLVIAETLESSWEDALAYLTPLNLSVLALDAVLCTLFSLYIGKTIRRYGKVLPLLNTGLIFATLACLFAALAPSSVRENTYYYWPISDVHRTAAAYEEAVHHNVATVRQVESLTSPADSPSQISTLKGGEGVVLIVHVGESVRADRMTINGYERDTTPWLSSCRNLINFPYCISAAGDTCQAQIAILTDARRDIKDPDPSMKPTTGSVLDLFVKHGFRMYTFFGQRCAQQLKYDRVVRMLTSRSVERFNSPASPWASLPQMDGVLAQTPRNQNLLFFINNEGSHTPFYHYDKENPPFTPTTDSFQNPASQAEEVNNAYDNTIHYTDVFFRSVVSKLKGRPWVYLYVSDHGEYLGHHDIWGRAGLGESDMTYLESSGSHVGMFVLHSPEFAKAHPHFAAALEQLAQNAQLTVAHEHVFHTLLGLFGIRTQFYDESLDLTSPQAKPYSGPHPEGLRSEP